MAAWLAYLKSRLLLPEPEKEGEPTGAEMAARLALQLQRLEAMRNAADQLLKRDQVGLAMFLRGQPEGVRIHRKRSEERRVGKGCGGTGRPRGATDPEKQNRKKKRK